MVKKIISYNVNTPQMCLYIFYDLSDKLEK